MSALKLENDLSSDQSTRPIATVEDANSIIRKVVALDEAFTQVGAFYALQSEINELARKEEVNGTHADIMRIVRASALRSTITGIMACLDNEDRQGRNNRAGVGEISRLLQAGDFSKVFLHLGSDELSSQIGKIDATFKELRLGESFKAARDLRDAALAHILLKEAPPKQVEYSEITGLYNSTALFIDLLYRIVGQNAPRFPSFEADHRLKAETFIATYKCGMKAKS